MAARDTQVSGANSSTATVNVAITVGVGATLCVVEISGAPAAMSTGAGGFRVTGVTIGGGSAFTLQYGDPGSGGVIAGEVWAYLNPPSGAQTVVIQRLGGGFAPYCYTIKTYTGTDASSFLSSMSAVTRQTSNSGSTTTTYTYNVASASVDDITESWICASSVHTAIVPSAGAVQTQDGTATDGNSAEQRSGWAQGTGGVVAHTWDMTADTLGRLAYGFFFSVKNAVGGGGTNPAGAQACMAGESKLVGGRMAV